uniref:Uncharacterized protein LOC107424401 isoform X1 n=1 Tax=Rhizophora mucronata TaxID=61149 RepID=A0A2P2PUL3_RHIMU
MPVLAETRKSQEKSRIRFYKPGQHFTKRGC